MNTIHLIRAWGRILTGRIPSLSVEITRECPLRCPGCYAYEDAHLGGGVTLRQLTDHKGDDLVQRMLDLVDRERPLHLSIVGGDPLVRYRELEVLVPKLTARGIHVQVVTSAFRPLPAQWASMPLVNVVVSIDGLQPEHDERRKPATYDRILKNIAGQRVTIHCTVTSQMMHRPGYLDEFMAFWAARPEIRKVWVSIFTPQRGARPVECLSTEQRQQVIADLLRLREAYPKLDMAKGAIAEFAHPPQTPRECIFSRTTQTLSADLKTMITPCQYGGDPDCSQCGCVASMGLAAVGHHKLGGIVPVGAIYMASARIGETVAWMRQPWPARTSRPSRSAEPAPAGND